MDRHNLLVSFDYHHCGVHLMNSWTSLATVEEMEFEIIVVVEYLGGECENELVDNRAFVYRWLKVIDQFDVFLDCSDQLNP